LDVRTILRVAREKGLAGVAVTDHGTVAGGLAAREANRDGTFFVIPGAEYATDAGHLLGLFLPAELELPGRGPWRWQEVVAAIRARGGLAFLAHPFKHRHHLPPALLAALDGLETFNARAGHGGNPKANADAAALAARLGLAVSGGSDAHWVGEIGRGYWELPGDEGASTEEKIREMLAQGRGRAGGRPSPLYYETCSQALQAARLKEYRRLPRIMGKLVLSCAGLRAKQRRS
ncbi:MAG: hypothetical protein H5U00_08665, partial [Clostridia bacterium]|nr:hypothetical protein [Clostridia bacterium]